jgi:diguanylate cyclase (GGDEF)-like protein
MRSFLHDFLSRLPNRDATALVVSDQHGRVLARIAPPGRAAGGRTRIAVTAQVPQTTWRLRLDGDRAQVLAGVSGVAWLAWAMLGVLALAVLAVLWLCARQLLSTRRIRHANAALRESEGKLRGLVEALEEAVVLRYADGRVELLNASAKKLFDTESDWYSGTGDGWAMLDRDGSPIAIASGPAASVLAGGDPDRRLIGLEHADRQRLWLEVSTRPLTRPGEKVPYAVVCSCTDVSARQELEAHLLDLVDRDPLTGLWNRRRFEQDLARQLDRCRRYDEDAALVLMDVDGFKQVNDGLGHLAGDEVLRALSDVLRARLRGSDHAARLGGDEFAVMLLHVSEAEAQRIAADLAARLGAAAGAVQDGIDLSVSFGTAMLGGGAAGVIDALDAADRAMYACKQGRRSSPATGGYGAAASATATAASGDSVPAEMASLRALLAAVNARDSYTAVHSRHVVTLARGVARMLGLEDGVAAEVEHVALLHDLGKIAVPDAILCKPGPLTHHEQTLMRQHPVVGAEILASMPELAHLAASVRAEHERWDGGGYPDGLAGEEIPIASRIVLVCDAYHAMTSDRPYRRAMSSGEAREEIGLHAGSQFCPRAAAALLVVLSDLDGIAVVAGARPGGA